MKTDLNKRILSSVDAHKKLLLRSVPELFPHERKFSIYRSLLELKKEGWIRINKSYVEDGERINLRCVLRKKKSLYKQQTLKLA